MTKLQCPRSGLTWRSVVALCSAFSLGGCEDNVSAASKELATVEVKIRLSDTNANFENVSYHSIEDKSGKDLSIVCGTVRPSKPPLQQRRFVYHVAGRDLAMSGIDPRLDETIFSLCSRN